MTARNTLHELLAAVRDLPEIPYSRLDEILETPAAFDADLQLILEQLGQKPLRDDLFAQRLWNDPIQPGVRHDGLFARYVDGVCQMTADDEVRVAKRIEFARHRLDRALKRGDSPGEVKDRYFDVIDIPETNRAPIVHDGVRPQADQVQERFYEFLAQRNEMVEKSIALVQRIALRYRTYGIPVSDLEQHGTIGLIRAADKFDWRRQVRFRTYAEWWIRQAIERATDTDRDVIHVPRPMRQKLSRANHLHRSSGGERPLDASRFAELTGVDRHAAARALTIKTGVMSLERTGPEDGRCLRDDLEGPDLGAAREREELDHLRSRVRGLLNGLPQREATVLQMRFGLDGANPQTLEEVGQKLHISRERVRQLQVRALLHLKDAADPRDTRNG